MSQTTQEALLMIRAAAQAARERGDLAAFLGELERVRVEALLSPAAPIPAAEPAAASDGALLTAEQAGRLVGRSRWWVYEHRHELGALVPLPGGRYGFSRAKLEAWIRRRTG